MGRSAANRQGISQCLDSGQCTLLVCFVFMLCLDSDGSGIKNLLSDQSCGFCTKHPSSSGQYPFWGVRDFLGCIQKTGTEFFFLNSPNGTLTFTNLQVVSVQKPVWIIVPQAQIGGNLHPCPLIKEALTLKRPSLPL